MSRPARAGDDYLDTALSGGPQTLPSNPVFGAPRRFGVR
jgi:hypothetical protein